MADSPIDSAKEDQALELASRSGIISATEAAEQRIRSVSRNAENVALDLEPALAFLRAASQMRFQADVPGMSPGMAAALLAERDELRALLKHALEEGQYLGAEWADRAIRVLEGQK